MTKDTFGAIFTRFMKAIHVQLANETINFFVPKIFGENDFLELVGVFDDEIPAGRAPENYLRVFFVLNYNH